MQHSSTSMNKTKRRYKQLLSQYLKCDSEDICLYWKGRVALYAILKAMGVQKGDEVIVQGYTCVVVANAILYLGAKPVYVDIDSNTYNMNLRKLTEAITNNTKVVICQNTYGLSSNLEEIQKIASEKGIYTIEDCTHGFGGYYRGIPNGSSCDASFFSTQWNKPFSTGIGGFAVIHNHCLMKKMIERENQKISPNFKECIELSIMYFVRGWLVNDITYWSMVNLYRWLSRKNIVIGSSSGEEVTSIRMPNDYFKGMSVTQMKKGIKNIRRLKDVNIRRKKCAAVYTDFLVDKKKNHVKEELFSDHMFLRYPLLVNDRDEFRKKAEREKIILGEWFEAPVYPCYGNMRMWGVKEKDIPVSMDICKKIVNLPTDVKDMKKIISFLEKEIDLIVDEQ